MLLRLLVPILCILLSLVSVTVADAEGVNLVPNASLESGATTPTSWFKGGWGSNTRTLSYPVSGSDGSRAVSVTISNFQSGDAKWYSAEIAVTPGKQYIVRDRYQSTAMSHVSVRYLRSNGTYTYSPLGGVPTSASWQQFSATTTAPADAVSATIFHVLAGNGTLTTDAYEFRQADIVPPPPPPPPPQSTSTPSVNLIPNGSLETVSSSASRPDTWQRGGWGTNNRTLTYPVTGFDGSKAAEVSITTFTNGDAKWYFDPIPVSAGKEYVFKNNYRSSVQTEVLARFGLANGSYSYVFLGKATSSPNSWATFSKSVTAPQSAKDVTVFHVLASVGTLIVDSYSLYEVTQVTSESLITLTFDDAYLSQYQKALPILEAAGVDASFYITTGRVGTVPERFMTWEQIHDLAAKGHEIGGHTRNHLSLPTLSHDEQYAQVRGSYDDLVAQGFVPRTFAYPFGDENAAVHAVVQEAGFVGARGVVLGYSDRNSNRYALNDQHIESHITLEDVKGYIDAAMLNKKWLILELHHQEDVASNQYSNSPALLQGIVDYIKEKNIQTVTLTDGLTRVFGN